MLAAVPASQAQQTPVPASTQQSDPRTVEAPIGTTIAQTVAQAVPDSAEMTRAGHTAAESAAIDPTARNVLAIIGAIVVVIALIALLR